MPEPDRSRLGSRHIRIEADSVEFLPSRLQAWRGIHAISFPYADIASLVMTDPHGLSRGRLVVRLGNGDAHTMSFRSGRLPGMRRIYREVWQRIRLELGSTRKGGRVPASSNGRIDIETMK